MLSKAIHPVGTVLKMTEKEGAEQAPHPQTQCGLFSLPAEIRDYRDYTYALVLTVGDQRSLVTLEHPTDRREKLTVMSILQTCRLILEEAGGLFYALKNLKCNLKHAYNHDDLRISNFARVISCRRLAAIETLTVVTEDFEQLSFSFKALCPFKGVQSLVGKFRLNPRNVDVVPLHRRALL